MPSPFCWYQLRTTDTGGARAFYADVVGVQAHVTPLPERAAARGAPPHWLGHIRVDDVEAATDRFVALGAERLGPPALRDPFGSVVALTSRTDSESSVAWHELQTRDAAHAARIYAEVFGWTLTGAFDPEGVPGRYHLFSWGGGDAGGVVGSVGLSGVHPHWMFYFPVDDIDRAAVETRARGGIVLGAPRVGTTGARFVQCDDPQGAAFGLMQRESAPGRCGIK